MLSNSSTNKIEKEFENLRKELLDLTLRNQLLNFKSRAKTIVINNQTPINIFQTLVLQENKMYLVSNKKEKKEEKSSVWDHIPFDFSKFSEGNKKLEVDLTPNELQKRLYYINNQARTMHQEQKPRVRMKARVEVLFATVPGMQYSPRQMAATSAIFRKVAA